jgi:regulator of RNase E activity RraA
MTRSWIPLLLIASAAAQVTPDPKLRVNRNTYHPVVEVLRDQRTAVTDAQLEQLKKLPLEAVWAAVNRLGYIYCYVSGLKTTRPQERLAGRALTIRYLPRRPDLDQAMETLAKEGDWPRGYHVRAAEEARPGDVLVVDLGGVISGGVFFGDISALGAQMAGARGAVLWGSTRDLTELQEMAGFPVLAVGLTRPGPPRSGWTGTCPSAWTAWPCCPGTWWWPMPRPWCSSRRNWPPR